MTLNDARLIEELAAECGIQPDFYDIWGKHHQVDPEAKRSLLRAMGLGVGDTAELRATTSARQRASWTRVLPPVLVVSEAAHPVRVALSLPVSSVRRVNWTVEEERGLRHEGRCAPEDLPVAGHAEVDGQPYARHWLQLPIRLPIGYHRLSVNLVGTDAPADSDMGLFVTPMRCYQPPALAGGQRVWGPALQLYGMRTDQDWGIGDFSALHAAVNIAGDYGADIVGLNPLHALFTHNPRHASPYSPSSRLFLNLLYIDVEALPEFNECEEARRSVRAPLFQQALTYARQRALVNYEEVARLKRPVLEQLYQHFRAHHLGLRSARGRAFLSFVARAGRDLERFAIYEALQEHFNRADRNVYGWPAWPLPYQDPESAEVGAFARAYRERVQFFQYVQWAADQQFGAAAARAVEQNLAIGLYADLAVSVDRSGADVWAGQQVYALGASIGAPPDDFSLNGQDWGLPPMIPDRLRQLRYQPFVALLQANMRHAAALRIDHVMGLMRLYWVPRDRSAREGAYVHYPLDDLLGIVALESHRNQCLVIGEDLGTVPDEVRDAMRRVGMLSYCPLLFTREKDGKFRLPGRYPKSALVTATTHDLPTLHGYWLGRDIAVRAALGLFPRPEQQKQQLDGRAWDRGLLLWALQQEDLLPPGMSTDPAAVPELTPALVLAIHRYLARTPALVMMIQWEELLGVIEQANLPGTTYEHPNWRRRMPVTLAAVAQDPIVRQVIDKLRRERGSTRRPSDTPVVGAPRSTVAGSTRPGA